MKTSATNSEIETEKNYKLKYYPAEFEILDIKHDRTVRFFGADGKEIGCFDFGKSPATFTGDVDGSAKMFVDAILRMWPSPN